MAAIHIPPTVADHPALRKVNAQFPGGAEEHAGLGLAAIAIGFALAGVVTDLHTVNGQLRLHVGVDGFDDGLLERAATDIGLVGGDDDEETRGFQAGAGTGDIGQDIELSQAGGRVGLGFLFRAPG